MQVMIKRGKNWFGKWLKRENYINEFLKNNWKGAHKLETRNNPPLEKSEAVFNESLLLETNLYYNEDDNKWAEKKVH